MQKTLAAVLFSLVLLPAAAQQPPPPEFRLGDAARPRAYDLRLAIDPREERFEGEVRIELTVQRPVPVLWLNAEKLEIVEAVFRQGERRIEATVLRTDQDYVGFAAKDGFPAGETVAEIRYRGPIEPVATRGIFRQREGHDWYVVSQFEAINARRAMPCFDEPHWKTPWRVTIDAPAGEGAFSNTPEESSAPLSDRPGWKRHVFARTEPLPTYLVALAVGPFEVVAGGATGSKHTPLRYLALKGRAADLRYAKEASPRILALLEEYFGQPYPFAKLDSAPIPSTVGFGAMENVGLVTYSSDILMAPPARESISFKRRYAAIAAHEMAHQWFGDLVTLAWWDDVWLNESFATWMSRKTLRQFQPEWAGGWREGEQRRRALSADRFASARRIANPVVVKNDVFGSFDAITYAKGGEVLSMFEAWLGSDRFREGVRRYLKDHAYANATSLDFFRALGDASGRGESAVAAFRSFIEQPGFPVVEMKLQCKGKQPTLEVAQRRFVPRGGNASEGRWVLPACFRYEADGKLHKQCAEIEGPKTIALTEARSCPDWIVGNADGAGHWVPSYEKPMRERLLARAAKLPEAEAVALAFDVSLLLESGHFARGDALRFADALLAHPSLGVKQGAVEMLEEQREEWLDAAQREQLRRIEQRHVVPLAAKLGWGEHPNEHLADQDLRTVLLPYAARLEGGQALRQQARERALRWLGDRKYLAASTVTPVLQTAARFADNATFTRIEHAMVVALNRRDRGDMLNAMALVRDPTLRERSFSTVLAQHGSEPTVDGRETFFFLEKALGDDHNRVAAFEFMRRHWEALQAKLPPESATRLMRTLRGLCTPADRAAFADFYGERSKTMSGGPRAYSQTLEAIDVCVAATR